jgi:hypothetical protein
VKLRAIIEQSGPVRLVIGGPPCEDLALVNADRTGGPNPSAFLAQCNGVSMPLTLLPNMHRGEGQEIRTDALLLYCIGLVDHVAA